MPFAIALRLDRDSHRTIASLWDALAAAGVDSDRTDLGYTAHITLAIYPDDTPEAPLRAAVDRAGGRWTAIPVGLSGFGIFPGPPSVLFAAPIPTADLLARQQEIVAALPDFQVGPHYRSSHWVPHVTLSSPLVRLDAALAVLTPLWRPVEGRLVGLDLLRFRPMEVLASRDFG